MKNILVLLLLMVFLFSVPSCFAIEDPLSTPNNKYGIHILFDSEVQEAAKLVNSRGGDWGYITIPIQAGDRDLIKWQAFMDSAKKHHVIPMLRLATEGDYFNTKAWRKPNANDIVDFVNFLDSLEWPVKNRYIIVFNEVNRGDEWGGEANPAEYAKLLSYAYALFKSRSPEYFILNAGLDNAAPNQGSAYINEYAYLQGMQAAVPGIFNKIDGFSSHAYPNPGFSQPPARISTQSIASFLFETQLIDSLSSKKVPVFITETGWNSPSLSPDVTASYYKEAFANTWADKRIAAITPFLLRAGGGPFGGFTFLDSGGGQTPMYKAFAEMPKQKGNPTLSLPIRKSVLGSEIRALPQKRFSNMQGERDDKPQMSSLLKDAIKWILKI